MGPAGTVLVAQRKACALHWAVSRSLTIQPGKEGEEAMETTSVVEQRSEEQDDVSRRQRLWAHFIAPGGKLLCVRT